MTTAPKEEVQLTPNEIDCLSYMLFESCFPGFAYTCNVRRRPSVLKKGKVFVKFIGKTVTAIFNKPKTNAELNIEKYLLLKHCDEISNAITTSIVYAIVFSILPDISYDNLGEIVSSFNSNNMEAVKSTVAAALVFTVSSEKVVSIKNAILSKDVLTLKTAIRVVILPMVISEIRSEDVTSIRSAIESAIDFKTFNALEPENEERLNHLIENANAFLTSVVVKKKPIKSSCEKRSSLFAKTLFN